MPPAHRVLLIGFDGATLDLAEPWMRAGYLPALSKLMARGGAGRLRSVLPVLSPAAWASFFTGVNPGAHGIFDFVQRQPRSYQRRLTTATDLKAPTLWRLLSDAGKRIAVVNVPMTWPPESVNGVMVTGLGTPDRQAFTYPAAFGERLRAGGYRVNKSVFYRPGAEAAFLKEVYAVTGQVAQTALDLLRQEAWDLFMVVFRDSDEMAHYFWKHMDASHPAHNPSGDRPYATALQDYYRHLDEWAARLIDAAGPEVNVIVMSDHGMGPLYKDVFLNEWLRRQDLLALEAQSKLRPAAALARLGLTRSNVSRTLQGMGLHAFERNIRAALGERMRVLPANGRASFPDAIAWDKTRAYSFGYHGQIFLNVRGREPLGTVEPGEEYAKLRSELAEALKRWVDPADGQPVVSEIILQEQAFRGPYAAEGADLTVIMRDMAFITRQGYELSQRAGQVFSPPLTHESGSHRQDGLLFAAGPDFKTVGAMPDFSIMDLAPTILHLLGLPVADHMDGRVLSAILASSLPLPPSAAYASAQPENAERGLTEDEEREILERLKNLGYLG